MPIKLIEALFLVLIGANASAAVTDTEWCAAQVSAAHTFRARRADLPIVVNNWSWDVTGLDLLREDRRLDNADYKKSRLAIIDTGLRLQNNPDAGAQLIANSPEQDYDNEGHGTGVAGVAASAKFGVNPRLQIKAVPSKFYNTGQLTGESIINQMNGNFGFNSKQLAESVATAVRDPEVKVINASLSTIEDPAVLALYKEALQAGKWIVVPPANSSGKVNDIGDAGFSQLKGYEGFFIVGAMSYFGAPASFAHAGPETQYYSPGASIETLSSRYNSNWDSSGVTPPSKAFDGGSFASPHVAAILATVRSILPDIDAKMMRTVLEKSNLVRGKSFQISQVNDYAVLWLALAAHQQRLAGKCAKLIDCFEQSYQLAQQEVQAIKSRFVAPDGAEFSVAGMVRGIFVEKPAHQNLSIPQQWELLRKGYFLSRGDAFFGESLVGLIPQDKRSKWAEFVYLHPSKDIEFALQRFSETTGPVKANFEAAVKFYREGAPYITDQPVPYGGNQQSEYLKKLPATVENLPRFLQIAGPVLRGAPDMLGVQNYIDHAPNEFIFQLCQSAMQDDHFAFTDLPLEAESRIRQDPRLRPLSESLFEKSARNWDWSSDFRSLEVLKARMEKLSPIAREILLSRFKQAVNSGKFKYAHYPKSEDLNKMELELLSWASDETLASRKTEVVAYLRGDKREAEGNLNLMYRRWLSGHVTREQLEASFDTALADVAAHPGEGGRVISYVAANAAERDPELTLHIANAFVESGQLEPMYKAMHGQIASQVMAGLINAVPDEIGAALMNDVARAWADQDYGPGWVRDTWFLSREKPGSKAFGERILRNAQNDPGLQSVRVKLLEFYAKQAEMHGPIVDSYLREAPPLQDRGDDPLLDLQSQVVVRHKELMDKFVAQLDQARSCQRDCRGHLHWMTRANSKEDFHAIALAVVPRLADMLRHTNYFEDYDVEKVVTTLGGLEGNNPQMMSDALAQFKGLFFDTQFMKSYVRPDATGSRHDSSRDEGVIAAVQVLGLSREGSKILAADSDWVEQLASYIVARPDMHLLKYNLPIPKVLASALRRHLPSAQEIAQTKGTSNWVRALFEADPLSIPDALAYLATPQVRSNQLISSDIAHHLRSVLLRNPATQSQIDAFFERDRLPNRDGLRKIIAGED